MTPNRDLKAAIAAQHRWEPTGSYYTCAKCGEPYRGREDGCGETPAKRPDGPALAIAAIVAFAWLNAAEAMGWVDLNIWNLFNAV